MGSKIPIPKKDLGEAIKDLRQAHKKTQKEVADEINRTVKTYRSWEKGIAKPGTEDLESLAKVFGVDVDHLLGNIGEQTHDLDFVCRYTGLSAKAIDNAKKCDPGILSSLIGDPAFPALIVDLVDLCGWLDALAEKREEIEHGISFAKENGLQDSGFRFEDLLDLERIYNQTRLDKNELRDSFSAIIERIIPTASELAPAKKILREYGALSSSEEYNSKGGFDNGEQ